MEPARMTLDDLIEIHKDLCEGARDLMRRKNHDYAGASGQQPFANFERVEALGICTTEKGFLVRLTDKMSRLSSFTDSGEFAVKDETLRDTLTDVINYAVLLLAYSQAKKSNRYGQG